MTKEEKLKRNLKIIEYRKEHTAQTTANKFKLSLDSVFRILRDFEREENAENL